MNRWRQRLSSLQGNSPEQPSAATPCVQSVQNPQNIPPAPAFEHSEQIEHRTEPAVAPASPAERAIATWGEAEAERAAIVEHDGGIPHAWAEGFARLHPDRAPAGVPLRRWQAVIDAIGTFLDRWAAVAAALGWQAADIFGADAARPEVTWLNAGPLWSGDGARVVEVHADRIIFETKGGARQNAYRRPHLRPRSLPWELAPSSIG